MNFDQAERVIDACKRTNDWACPQDIHPWRWRGILRYFGFAACESCLRPMKVVEGAEIFCMPCLMVKFKKLNAAREKRPFKPVDWSEVPASCGGSLV